MAITLTSSTLDQSPYCYTHGSVCRMLTRVHPGRQVAEDPQETETKRWQDGSFIVFAPKISISTSLLDSLVVGNLTVCFSQSAKNFGLTLEMHVTMAAHVLTWSEVLHFELRRISSKRHYVSVQDTKTPCLQYNKLYCLCVEKYAFWLVIYIKTFNTVNDKTSTTQ